MFSFLRKKEMPLKEKEEEKGQILSAFISGKVIPIEETPDPVFAQKVMGGEMCIRDRVYTGGGYSRSSLCPYLRTTVEFRCKFRI